MPQPNGQLATSRYAQTPVAIHRTPGGREIPYLAVRRPVLDAPIQGMHAIVASDRLDLIAHDAYGDPTQYWRICDAGRATWPGDLTAQAGRRLPIPSAFGGGPA